MTPRELWQRYQAWSFEDAGLALRVDLSRMGIEERAFAEREPLLQAAYEQMAALEKGAIANPDEKRMVGHYWLRAPELAPDARDRARRSATLQARIKDFAGRVHAGRSPPSAPRPSSNVLVIGIGGSALGPQLVADALGARRRPPDAALLRQHRPRRHRPRARRPRRTARRDARASSSPSPAARRRRATACSKPTPRTQARGLELRPPRRRRHRRRQRARPARARSRAGSRASRCGTGSAGAPRVTVAPSACCRRRCRGSTSTRCSPARGDGRGHAPARRRAEPGRAARARCGTTPASGRGAKDMVVLPYKDRLVLFSRYLQQLVMESLGKELDLDGKRRQPGDRGLRQQGLHRPARLRAAAPRRA